MLAGIGMVGGGGGDGPSGQFFMEMRFARFRLHGLPSATLEQSTPDVTALRKQ